MPSRLKDSTGSGTAADRQRDAKGLGEGEGIQSVARHNDVNLTMGVYSHVEIQDQAGTIVALAKPPEVGTNVADGEQTADTDSGWLAQEIDFECLSVPGDGTGEPGHESSDGKQIPLPEQGLVIVCHPSVP